MGKLLRGLRPSPALIVACLALFVAMGGVGYAALKLKPNSVKTKNIKNGAVKEAKIADGAVTGGKLANGAVTNEKIANGAVTGQKFLLSSTTQLNFGMQPGPSCDSREVPATGITANDSVVVTPPPGFPNTFTLEGHPTAGGNAVAIVSCNTFDGGGAVDPDGAGGAYKLLVIR